MSADRVPKNFSSVSRKGKKLCFRKCPKVLKNQKINLKKIISFLKRSLQTGRRKFRHTPPEKLQEVGNFTIDLRTSQIYIFCREKIKNLSLEYFSDNPVEIISDKRLRNSPWMSEKDENNVFFS